MLGLELSFDRELAGQPGYTYVERDNYASHGELPFAIPTRSAGESGCDLNLTLDLGIQRILQEEISNAAMAYEVGLRAEGIIMDPMTGDILAMCQNKTFDNANPAAVPAGLDPDTWQEGRGSDPDLKRKLLA